MLVVDDDPDVVGMLQFALEDSGFSVRTATDGKNALTALEEHAPDVIVLDLMMPNLDGFGLLRSRRQRNLAPDARVVIVTCKTSERDYVRGWELGADEYVTKPFEPDRLVRIVRELAFAQPEVLQQRRDAELQKAELLERLESAFSRPRVAPRAAAS
ncbi:MAG: two-component system, OmpR family, alkaline phosphatase synthesis response regulator PhoP [Actinomycetota bacterium]|nr:two-component system, OmpR family, alkaline phosphatase synthesis response regulator PhoP [Actinomycetota bacterium]